MKNWLIPSILFFMIFGFSCTEEESNSFNEDKKDINPTPYCSEVIDYYYAPGQHAYRAEFPNFVQGDSCEKSILLGGWGGYVVMAFDHDVINEEGCDIIIYCGSSVQPEPGVVYFMQDENENGLPDEEWYEVKGSEFNHSTRGYSLTYYAPNSEGGNVKWKDNQGGEGELPNSYSWWWRSEDDSVTFTGTLLPEAYVNNGDTVAPYWEVKRDLFLYGYAENGKRVGNEFALDYLESKKGNCFDISDVVDERGDEVDLTSVRFIKVQSGVFQIAGWLGEISTEINGAADLHLLK